MGILSALFGGSPSFEDAEIIRSRSANGFWVGLAEAFLRLRIDWRNIIPEGVDRFAFEFV